MLIVISSKSRFPIRREMETRPGNSDTQGAHHVAHTLNNRSFSVLFATSEATPDASMGSMLTGVFSQRSISCVTVSFLESHLVEQPIGLVISTATALPAINASTAL